MDQPTNAHFWDLQFGTIIRPWPWNSRSVTFVSIFVSCDACQFNTGRQMVCSWTKAAMEPIFALNCPAASRREPGPKSIELLAPMLGFSGPPAPRTHRNGCCLLQGQLGVLRRLPASTIVRRAIVSIVKNYPKRGMRLSSWTRFAPWKPS